MASRGAASGAAWKRASSNKGPKYFAVVRGRVPGVYATWVECQRQVHGHSGAMHKSFKTLGEAHAFMKEHNAAVSAPPRSPPHVKAPDAPPTKEEAAEAERRRNKRKLEALTAGARAPPPSDVDRPTWRQAAAARQAALERLAAKQQARGAGADASPSPEREPSPKRPKKLLYYPEPKFTKDSFQPKEGHVYIDGACLDMPDGSKRCGVGVYFGPLDAHNVSERLEGREQTSCRAEFAACLLALRLSKRQMVDADCTFRELLQREREADARAASYETLTILTDSKLLMDACTLYLKEWVNSGKNRSGKTPKNLDLLILISAEMQGRKVVFEKVRAHSGNRGNDCADALAKAGAMKEDLPVYQRAKGSLSIYGDYLGTSTD